MTEFVESEQGRGMIGPMLEGDDHDTANDDAKMDMVESPAGKQTNNISCTISLKSNQTQSKISPFSNWRIPDQNSQTNYAQMLKVNVNYNYNLNDPEVETAARQCYVDVRDDKGDNQDQDFFQADGCPLMYWKIWFGGTASKLNITCELRTINTGILIY